MSIWAERCAALLALTAACAMPSWAAGTAEARAAIGRTATPAEVAAWDIDVRPDFKGLPKGSGTVAQGQRIWDGKCASCHGDFGESNEVFTPLVGGTTAEDIQRGRVGAMTGNQPYRTTLMKVSTVSTLWDYIHRAMPWNAPKSLSVKEVYAVTAYLLHLGEIVPADFTLSDVNIAAVQRRMPNRDGMTTDHGLWPGRGRPDTRNTACMKDCTVQVSIASAMPDYARDAHGDLAQQQRGFGPVRGVAARGAASASDALATQTPAPAGARLASQYQCVACHAMDRKLVGPSFADIAGKYKGQDVHAALARKVKAGGQGAWGSVPMPPQPQIPDSDVHAMVGWILEAK
ncbi:c-type cytochrome [Cupriavidus sp. NPDC089707]|uniref:c-type cytochrome n=1 Tax=Cupriavidus sp. NPDC089707 TaxID=3363963 RepID=UPI0037F51DD6